MGDGVGDVGAGKSVPLMLFDGDLLKPATELWPWGSDEW